MITFNEVLAHLEARQNGGTEVSSQFRSILASRTFPCRWKDQDFSYVDDSTSTYTIKQYKTIFPRQSI